MRVLKNIQADVPCGWEYKVPETGFACRSDSTFSNLLGRVTKHYIVNKLDIPQDLSFIIQDQIASRIPEDLSKEV